jgi:fatty acid desaturase
MSDILFSEGDNLLLKLKVYLNYQLSSSLLYLLSFVYGITIFVTAAAAVIFTPFLIYTLYKNKKFFWLLIFVTAIIIPPPALFISGIGTAYFILLLFIQLGLFYFYCFILRFVVNDWIEEIQWKALRTARKKESDADGNAFIRQFEKTF